MQLFPPFASISRAKFFKQPGRDFNLYPLLVFNGSVLVTDDFEQTAGFPYFSLADRPTRLSPDEPINLNDVVSGRRSAARGPMA